MAELGRIDRPEVGAFAGKRKLYCVANIYSLDDAPDEYKTLVNRYWDEVARQIEKLEAAGKVRKIFCEILSGGDAEALKVWEKVNERGAELIKKKMDEGAILVPVEKDDILGPYTDWGNCLRVVFTREVFTKILGFFTDLAGKRITHIMETIDGSLAESEVGLLIMKEEDRLKLQFPSDVEVFLVTPPSYDDIMRWARERGRKKPNDQNQDD